MKMFDLTGKVAVVTGGNGGIGLGMALGLAEAGADIVIASRNPEKNAAAEAEVGMKGVKAMAVPTDIRDPDACRALIDTTVAELGRVDILINNSGINSLSADAEIGQLESARAVEDQALFWHFVDRNATNR